MTTIKGTVTVLLVATAYVSPSLSQTVTVSKAQLAKDMWVANAKYNIDTSGNYQLVAIAAGLHTAFAADPGLTSTQGQSIIHDTLNQLNSWRSSQGATATPTEVYEKTLTLMADVTTSSSVKAAAGITSDFGLRARQNYSDPSATSNQQPSEQPPNEEWPLRFREEVHS